MMIKHEVHSDLPIPPGEYPAEVIPSWESPKMNWPGA